MAPHGARGATFLTRADRQLGRLSRWPETLACLGVLAATQHQHFVASGDPRPVSSGSRARSRTFHNALRLQPGERSPTGVRRDARRAVASTTPPTRSTQRHRPSASAPVSRSSTSIARHDHRRTLSARFFLGTPPARGSRVVTERLDPRGRPISRHPTRSRLASPRRSRRRVATPRKKLTVSATAPSPVRQRRRLEA
jgi:hypothetical protein